MVDGLQDRDRPKRNVPGQFHQTDVGHTTSTQAPPTLKNPLERLATTTMTHIQVAINTLSDVKCIKRQRPEENEVFASVRNTLYALKSSAQQRVAYYKHMLSKMCHNNYFISKKLHNHHSYLTPPFLVLHAIDDDLSCNQKRPVYYYCIKMSTAILTTNGLKDRGIANILLYINKFNT